ncbi:hypothetical protein PNO24_00690 [Gemella haemolysans]|uniref:hypothetical protein n=1 Tax=Gemella haemolysans TaxID=1379 RepID=UPI0023312797|nr:hypothetical protein [Gemella haemolysans]MDB6212444.1 hypothetical protein [Gemella haemolysans]
MSKIIKMVDEIKEYYNLNDTLLASDLGIMQQTIRGWRDGRQPTTPNYNKVKKMYEEMKQEAVDESIVQRFEALEEKVEKKPYKVEVPENIGDYYTLDNWGEIYNFEGFTIEYAEHHYRSGLAFKTVEEAKKYYKERELLFKFHKWAEEHNGGWKPNWKDDEIKYYITDEYDRFKIDYTVCYRMFIKLPYFKSEELAEQFIEEFGDEIKEVLC